MEPKFIKDWEELSKETSPTHTLEIDVERECGWINPIKEDDDSWKDTHYLSTHTFYGNNFTGSTKMLQACGFNVQLANWDKQ